MWLSQKNDKKKWIIILAIIAVIIFIGIIVYLKKFPKWEIFDMKNRYGEIIDITPWHVNEKGDEYIKVDESKYEVLIDTMEEIINKRARYNKDIDMLKMWNETESEDVEMYQISIEFQTKYELYSDVFIYKTPDTYIINYWYKTIYGEYGENNDWDQAFKELTQKDYEVIVSLIK